MAKTQFNKIVVSYVAPVRHERIQNMFTGRYKMEAVPTGEQHIFEVENPGTDKESLSVRSFCGLAKCDISKDTKVYKERQPGGVCQKCSQVWKSDSRSPWAAWAAGEKVS